MGKLINNMKEKIKNILKTYPVTMITTLVLTIILSIYIDNNLMNNVFFDRLIECLIFFDFGVLFSEVYFDNKKRLTFFIIFLLLAIGLVILDNSKYTALSFKFVISYILIISILIIYKLFKKTKLPCSEYFIKVFSNLLHTAILYLVLSVGLLLITSAFNYLILDGDDIFILRIEILLFGGFLVPSIVLDITNPVNEVSNFIKILIHYILEILVIIAFIIIYLYIIKILLIWQLPSNEVFRILALLFVFSCPTWIMNEYYKDQLGKINSYLPLAFIPFIILECVSLGIRVVNHGLTNTRYLGIVLIIFQIIYIYIRYRKKKFELNFFVLIILTIISFLLPFINMISLSNYSQVKIIKNILISLILLMLKKIESVVLIYIY